MLKIHDVLNEGRDDVRTLEESGAFRVLEWNAPSPTTPEEARDYHYAQSTGMFKHQLVCMLRNELITLGHDSLLWYGGTFRKLLQDKLDFPLRLLSDRVTIKRIISAKVLSS